MWQNTFQRCVREDFINEDFDKKKKKEIVIKKELNINKITRKEMSGGDVHSNFRRSRMASIRNDYLIVKLLTLIKNLLTNFVD